jgi:hypothetical protein
VHAGEETTLSAALRALVRPEPPAPDGAAAADEPLPPERVQALREGYTGWHTAVRQRMLARWDEDGSGRLDREEEARAIPCSEWRELERSYDQGGLAVPMSRLYGFDGSGWVEGALGFTFPAREAAFARMRECGLR